MKNNQQNCKISSYIDQKERKHKLLIKGMRGHHSRSYKHLKDNKYYEQLYGNKFDNLKCLQFKKLLWMLYEEWIWGSQDYSQGGKSGD